MSLLWNNYLFQRRTRRKMIYAAAAQARGLGSLIRSITIMMRCLILEWVQWIEAQRETQNPFCKSEPRLEWMRFARKMCKDLWRKCVKNRSLPLPPVLISSRSTCAKTFNGFLLLGGRTDAFLKRTFIYKLMKPNSTQLMPRPDKKCLGI